MVEYARVAGFAAVLCTGAWSFGVVVPTTYEPFNGPPPGSDAYWIGVDNRGDGVNNLSDFGWSNTDNTGTAVAAPSGNVSGAGEMGGPLQRGNAGQYGFATGNITPNDTLHADGVYHWASGSGNWLIGWWNAGFHMSDGADPRNFIGLQFDDSTAIYSHVASNTDRQRAGAHTTVPQGQTIQWTMDYNPTGGSGLGQLSGTINGASYSVDVPANFKEDWLDMDRFGVFTVNVGTPVGTFFFDDITFSSYNQVPIPEPVSLGLLSLGATAIMRRRRR